MLSNTPFHTGTVNGQPVRFFALTNVKEGPRTYTALEDFVSMFAESEDVWSFTMKSVKAAQAVHLVPMITPEGDILTAIPDWLSKIYLRALVERQPDYASLETAFHLADAQALMALRWDEVFGREPAEAAGEGR